MENSDYIVVSVITILATILLLLKDAIFAISTNIGSWMYEFGMAYGYIGAFVISFFGNLTIIFPVPYSVAIAALGAYGLDPILLGVFAGIGATIGEISSYLLGRGMSMAQLEEKYGQRLKKVRQLVDEYGYLTVFIFAVTPLPDDMVMIPAGIIGLSLTKVIIASLIGKILLAIIIAYAGKYGFEMVSLMIGEDNPYSMVITLVGIIIISYLTIRIDWYKLWRNIRTSQTYIDLSNFLKHLNPQMLRTYLRTNPYLSIVAITCLLAVLSFITNVAIIEFLAILSTLIVLAIATYFEHKRVILELEQEEEMF